METADNFTWSANELPQMVVCGRFFHKANNFKVKYTCDINALHIYEYNGIIRIGSRQFSFQAGDITITPIGSTSTYKFSPSGLHYCIHFIGGKLSSDLFSVPLHIPAQQIAPPAGELIKKAIRIYNCPAKPSQRKINSSIASAMLLQSLLTLQNINISKPQNADKVEELLELIDMKLTEGMSVVQFAEHIGVSGNYLASMFKKRTGTTIKQYLLQRKIARAKYLLRSTTMQVKAVAKESGIADRHYFSKKFKEQTSISPLEYRKKHQYREN